MLVLVLICIISTLWWWSRRNKYKDEPPICNGSKILIGHALLFTGNSILLTNPEDCLTVSNNCLQKDSIYEFAKPWVGDGLITSSPSQWKVQRKLLKPAFSQHVLDNFMGVFNNKSRSLVKNLKVEAGKGPFDHWNYMKYFALETVCLTTLGVDLKEKSFDNTAYVIALAKVLNALITRFQAVWLHNNFLFSLSSLKKKQDDCIKILHDMANKILRQKKESIANEVINKDESKGISFKPFMELILELSRDTNAFTDREIREHVDTMIVAGHDTFAAVLMFCMLLVGSHPQVQEKIYEELKNIFNNEDRDVTKDDLSKLEYLEAVIKETMRIYPTVPVVGRYLDKDIKLKNCTLYKGNSAFLSIYGIYYHSMWGPDVEDFIPERWLDASKLPDCSHVSACFSIGRRNCIAQTYSMMSMKVALAHIYRNYFIHGDHTKLQMKLDVTLKATSGHNISIENRK